MLVTMTVWDIIGCALCLGVALWVVVMFLTARFRK